MSEDQEKEPAATEAGEQQESAAVQPAERPEQEYHPANPHFNPAHPDNAAWRSGPPSPDMPAEAGIVAMFQDPKGPISESDVHVEPPPSGPEFQTDPKPGTEAAQAEPAETEPTEIQADGSELAAGSEPVETEPDAGDTTTTKKPARRAR